jgi:hypothetical protein
LDSNAVHKLAQARKRNHSGAALLGAPGGGMLTVRPNTAALEGGGRIEMPPATRSPAGSCSCSSVAGAPSASASNIAMVSADGPPPPLLLLLLLLRGTAAPNPCAAEGDAGTRGVGVAVLWWRPLAASAMNCRSALSSSYRNWRRTFGTFVMKISAQTQRERPRGKYEGMQRHDDQPRTVPVRPRPAVVRANPLALERVLEPRLDDAVAGNLAHVRARELPHLRSDDVLLDERLLHTRATTAVSTGNFAANTGLWRRDGGVAPL